MARYNAMIDMLNLALYRPIKVGNVVFKPYSGIRDTLENIRKDRMPRVTAYAEILFDLRSENREDAFTKAEEILTQYGWLWSFAQNRTVFHWGISIYRIENGKSTFLGTSWRPVMVESSYGVPLIWPDQWQLFLETAIPVISSDDFIEKTNLILSMHLYLDANKPEELIEITFLKNWLALETLVNTYCSVKGIEFILPSSAFNRFRRRLKRFVGGDNEIGDDKKGYIIDNLPGLRRYPIRKCVDDFFLAHGIEYNKNDVRDIKKVRDSITHSGKLPRSMDFRTVVDHERKLRVLLQRSYLTLLGCSFTYSIDNRGFMHPELTKEEE